MEFHTQARWVLIVVNGRAALVSRHKWSQCLWLKNQRV